MPRASSASSQECDVAIYNRADALTAPEGSRRTRLVSIGLDAPCRETVGALSNTGWRAISRHRSASDMLDGRVDSAFVVKPQRVQRARGDGAGAGGGQRSPTSLGADAAGLQGVWNTVAQTVAVDRRRHLHQRFQGHQSSAPASRRWKGLGEAARRHIVLIAGGDAKNADLTPLRERRSRSTYATSSRLAKMRRWSRRQWRDVAPVYRVATLR